MNKRKKVLCVLVTVLLFSVNTITALAGSASKSAGIYGALYGESSYSGGILTTSRVTTNPNNANFVVNALVYANGDELSYHNAESENGVTSYTYRFAVPTYVGIDLEYAEVTHVIWGEDASFQVETTMQFP